MQATAIVRMLRRKKHHCTDPTPHMDQQGIKEGVTQTKEK